MTPNNELVEKVEKAGIINEDVRIWRLMFVDINFITTNTEELQKLMNGILTSGGKNSYIVLTPLQKCNIWQNVSRS